MKLYELLTNTHLLIETGGLILVILVIYLETAVFLGLVLPGGDYMLFATGIFCGTQYIDFPLLFVLVLVAAAAIAGDFTGYFKGRWLGEKLFTKSNSRVFKQDYLERSRGFYKRYGAWAFIIGRFLPVIRTLVPMLAGASGFNTGKFALFNVTGGVIWVGTLIPLGYYVGKQYPGILKYSVYILLIFILIASIPMLRILLGRSSGSDKDKS